MEKSLIYTCQVLQIEPYRLKQLQENGDHRYLPELHVTFSFMAQENCWNRQKFIIFTFHTEHIYDILFISFNTDNIQCSRVCPNKQSAYVELHRIHLIYF
jgi:hypothetical protein